MRVRHPIIMAFCGLVAVGCEKDSSDDDENDEIACTSKACEAQCASTVWAEFDESFWSFEADCTDDGNCRCGSRCDPDLCDAVYCQEERRLAGGYCFVTCECFGPDGGPLDGGPAR
jgi:hypothetical protein